MMRYRFNISRAAALLLTSALFSAALTDAIAADKPVTTGTEPADSDKTLKDLVTDKRTSGNDPLGMPFTGGNATSKYILNPEYSKESGATFTGAFGTLLGDSGAVGGILTVGGRKKEGILNLGYKTERQQLIVTLDQLRQSLNFDFLTGPERVELTQNSAAANYKFKLGNDSRQFIGLNAYRLKSDSRSLDDVIVITDTQTLFETASVQRRVAGGKVSGFQGEFAFVPFSGSAFKSSLGQERLEYGLAAGDSRVRRTTGGLTWNQQLFGGFSFTAAANQFAAQKRVSIGVERCLSGGQQVGVDFARIHGRDGAPNDNQVRLIWAATLGGTPSCSSAGRSPDPSDDAPTWRGPHLLDQIVLRPDFLPSQVVAKADDTVVPKRIIGVNRAGLPAGSNVDRNGVISVPLGACVPAVIGVTRNSVTFANSGQFNVSPSSCTTLTINPGGLPQPGPNAGDTYVVSTGTVGACNVNATVNVTAKAVTVAGVSTAGCDSTPDQFSFAGQVNVPQSTLIESAAVTITGINAAAQVSVVGGEYQINGGPWTTLAAAIGSVHTRAGTGVAGMRAGTITNGQTIKVRHTSAASANGSVSTTLTIGGVSATFTSTTAAANAAPTITNLPSLVNGVTNSSSVGLSVTFGDDKPFGGPASIAISALRGTISGLTGGSYGSKSFVYTAPPLSTVAGPGVPDTITFSVTDSDGVTTTTTLTFPVN